MRDEEAMGAPASPASIFPSRIFSGPLPPGPPPRPPAPPPPTPPSFLERSALAGFQYYDGRSVWAYLTPGLGLELRRERDNRHDPNAVAVYWGGHKLGYLPRHGNARAACLLDQGEDVFATIATKHEGASSWDCLTLSLWIRAPGAEGDAAREAGR